MKKLFFALLAFVCIATSCRKGTGDPAPTTHSKGTPLPKGTPIGNAATKTIGVAGGTISSSDSGIIVTVPAGAVSANIEFSIQAITNTAPNGIGGSYLVLPEGNHFDKPVSIQFKYTDDQLEGTVPEDLLVAFQDTAGIWNTAGGAQLDTIHKTITVASEHFSRWSIFANTMLFVDRPSIDHRETANLVVYDVIKKKDLADNDVIAALHKPGSYVPEDGATPTNFEVQWSYYKEGSLESIKGPNATYRAPDHDPTPNPVSVSADVMDLLTPLNNSLEHRLLTRKIYISSSYLEIVLNGNTNIYPNATAAFSNGILHIRAFNQAGNGGLLNPVLSGTGTFSWGNDGGAKDIFVWVGGIPFGDYYSVCEPPAHTETTKGIIEVTKWANTIGDYTEGEFEGEVVYNKADRTCTHVIKTVKGRFRAKRDI